MQEEASVAVRAEALGVELFTGFRFVLFVLGLFGQEFMFSMSELTFRTIPACSQFNPILAHFCLKLVGVQSLCCCTHVSEFPSG